jgi:fructose-bisphosphate aldolase class I
VTAPELVDTARRLVADGKGLLAMDESNATCDKRFAAAGIPQTYEARCAYREMLVTTPHLGDCISGVILYDETIRQASPDGNPGEKVTEGLDGLRVRLAEYFQIGARFAKWRAVISIGDGTPSRGCIDANAHALARYAALCQEAGIVPIIEPEVLMSGTHTIERCREVTADALRSVFSQLKDQRVLLEGLVLKSNMVLPGLDCGTQDSIEVVADATIKCLLNVVPAAVPGIAFLSGGQSGELASARLNAMNVQAKMPSSALPWPLTFSFARAIQQPALQIWHGENANRTAAQHALYHRAQCDKAALTGDYNCALERSNAFVTV